MMRAGDVVKLTERAARGRAKSNRAGKRVDWEARRGVIRSLSHNKRHAYVIWNGCHYADQTDLEWLSGV
jgi:hypothetical protein